MKMKDLKKLKDLFTQYYLEKRDDTSCHSNFAILTAKKCIETDYEFQSQEEKKK